MATRTIGTAIAVGTVAMVLSACGSSGGSGGSGNSGANTTASGTSKSAVLIGGTVSLSNPAFSQPELRSGLQAAVGSINAAGGVNGHPLKLDFCDGGYQVNKEVACSRKFIKDKVSAVLDPLAIADAAGTGPRLLQKANIAWFGHQAVLPTDLTLSNSFPLAGGEPGWAYGTVDALLRNGAKKISIILDTNPGSQASVPLLKQALKVANLSPTAVVTGDAASDPTFASAVAKATAQGEDGVLLYTAPLGVPKVLRALKQGGYKGKVAAVSALLNAELAKSLGNAAEGMLLSSQTAFVTDTNNVGVKAFLADMAKYAAGAKVDDAAIQAWSAVQLFAKAMAKQTDFSGAAVLKTLNSISTPIDIGTIAPYSTVGKTSPDPQAPRIAANPTVTFGVVKNGVIQSLSSSSSFVNPFEDLKKVAVG